MKTILKIIFAALIAVTIGAPIAGFFEVSPLAISGILFGSAFIPTGLSAALGMAVQVEIWEKDIEEALFKDNTFIDDAYNADTYVIQGKIVHIPQSGGPSNVVKNRPTLPATVRRRNDTDVLYSLDEFTTDPTLIPNADTVELSYDKRDSVIGEDKANLSQVVAEELLYSWALDLPAGAIIATSGADKPATAEGATGTRKAASRDDLQKMRSFLVKQRKWREGNMFALIPTDMLAQMFPANDAITATYSQNLTEEERRNGVVYKAYGWKIKERSTALRYATDGTLKAPEALGEATDNDAALFWEKNSVERAKGEIVMFQKDGDPQYYGDIYSFLVRMGGRRRRADNSGVAVLRQAA